MDKPEKHHGTHGRCYEGTDKAERRNAEEPEDKTSDERAKDPDHEVSD
jgi:hypothetical protein